MELIEKLNREGMNLKASKVLYDYLASQRSFEKVDNNSVFSLVVRSVTHPEPMMIHGVKTTHDSNKKLNQSAIS